MPFEKALWAIPRFSYEFLAYIVPGALSTIAFYLVTGFIWNRDIYMLLPGSIRSENVILGVSIAILFYVVGRALYSFADISIKPIVKKLCGDPDKYLLLENRGLLKKCVEDYDSIFKEKLKERFQDILHISREELPYTPFFKICIEYIEICSPTHASQIAQRHTIEIFSRNIASGTLVIAALFIVGKEWLAAILSLLVALLFTYYYYVRQIKRARSVYESFYAIAGREQYLSDSVSNSRNN